MVSVTDKAIKSRSTKSVTKGNAWAFADPDFANFTMWDKVSPAGLKEGDYIASKSALGNSNRVYKVIANNTYGKTGLVMVETVWSSRTPGKSGRPTGLQWQSLYNRNIYRDFTPKPKVAETTPSVEAVEESFTPALTALAGVDSGILTLVEEIREQNKILSCIATGISANQDTLTEIVEAMREAWGAKS